MSELMHLSSLDPNITLTEAACDRFLSCLREQADSKGVRLSVKKTGCSGLSYVVDYVFTENAKDFKQALGEYQLYVDELSYPYLKGMHIDYVKQGLNNKLVFSNPNQKGACGCGESFTVDE